MVLSASQIRSSVVAFLEVAIRWRMISVSEVVWKIEPWHRSFERSSSELVRLPLWATARYLLRLVMRNGWILISEDAPVVL